MRVRLTCLLMLVMQPFCLRAEETSEAILDHMHAVYAGLASYSDTGTLVREYTAASRDEFRFTTHFERAPRHFLFEFIKPTDKMVVWGDPDAFHVWWKATGQVTEFPNPRNTGALTVSDYPTVGAISKIPPLLYAKAGLPGSIQRFVPSRLAGMESVGSSRCYRLEGTTNDSYGQTGNTVNQRTLTVWIDSTSYLIRKIVEQEPPTPGALGRTTTTFDPQANPKVDDSVFEFAPPK